MTFEFVKLVISAEEVRKRRQERSRDEREG